MYKSNRTAIYTPANGDIHIGNVIATSESNITVHNFCCFRCVALCMTPLAGYKLQFCTKG